jgi:hypothetical protein
MVVVVSSAPEKSSRAVAVIPTRSSQKNNIGGKRNTPTVAHRIRVHIAAPSLPRDHL